MKTPVTLLMERLNEIEFYTEPYKSIMENFVDYAEQIKDFEKMVIKNAYNHGRYVTKQDDANSYFIQNFEHDTKSTQGSRISRTSTREDRADV